MLARSSGPGCRWRPHRRGIHAFAVALVRTSRHVRTARAPFVFLDNTASRVVSTVSVAQDHDTPSCPCPVHVQSADVTRTTQDTPSCTFWSNLESQASHPTTGHTAYELTTDPTTTVRVSLVVARARRFWFSAYPLPFHLDNNSLAPSCAVVIGHLSNLRIRRRSHVLCAFASRVGTVRFGFLTFPISKLRSPHPHT